jgi:hypothetical protein
MLISSKGLGMHDKHMLASQLFENLCQRFKPLVSKRRAPD